MLSELHIRNFALIGEVYLTFDPALNMLTGETGAGKTVVIEALNLLFGRRADPVLIGSHDKEALVEASFSDDGGELILSRLVSREGKNKCYANGKLATLTQLAEIGERMVDFHGQHEHQNLLHVSTHLGYLDRFGGDPLMSAAARVLEGYGELKAVRQEIEELTTSERERISRLDLAKFQIDEIGKAGLRAGEDEKLERERMILQNAEKLHQAVEAARQALTAGDAGEGAGAVDQLEAAARSLSAIAGIDETPKKLSESLQEMSYQANEAAAELRVYEESVEYSPERLDEIESRLSVLSLLKKKYGNTIDEILAYKKKIEQDVERLEGSGERLADLAEREKAMLSSLGKEATALSDERRKLARTLEQDVERELKELNLKHCRFKVDFSREEDITEHGIDKVEFLISPNPGEPLKPLAKIASGGEVSRIMLALKIVLIKADPVPILVFDEIDSGIGGKTAAEVGRKLAYLASTHQILCITHLPQIASFADSHFFVSKTTKAGHTETKVVGLDAKGKLGELSRMLSGVGETDITKKHAAELLTTASATKAAAAARPSPAAREKKGR